MLKIRHHFQPALFMRAPRKDRAFISEGEICQRQDRRRGIRACAKRMEGENMAFHPEGSQRQECAHHVRRRGILCHVGLPLQDMGTAGKTTCAQDSRQKEGSENIRSHRAPLRQIHLHGDSEKVQQRVIHPFPQTSPGFQRRSSHIEKLWRNTKKNATHLKYFKTFDDLRKSVLAAFGKYMSDAAEVIRVMKKLRSCAELQLPGDSFSYSASSLAGFLNIMSVAYSAWSMTQ